MCGELTLDRFDGLNGNRVPPTNIVRETVSNQSRRATYASKKPRCTKVPTRDIMLPFLTFYNVEEHSPGALMPGERKGTSKIPTSVMASATEELVAEKHSLCVMMQKPQNQTFPVKLRQFPSACHRAQ